MEKRIINRDFFERKAEKVARDLIENTFVITNKEYQITKTEGRALLYEASPFCLFFILPNIAYAGSTHSLKIASKPG